MIQLVDKIFNCYIFKKKMKGLILDQTAYFSALPVLWEQGKHVQKQLRCVFLSCGTFREFWSSFCLFVCLFCFVLSNQEASSSARVDKMGEERRRQ